MYREDYNSDILYSTYNDNQLYTNSTETTGKLGNNKRDNKRPELSGRRSAVLACLILTSLAIVVAALFFVLYVLGSPVQENTLTEWEHWSECTQTCGVGNKTRTRSCYHIDGECPNITLQLASCNVRECPWTPGPSPLVSGLNSSGLDISENETMYLCDDSSLSIDINSGSQVCPKSTYTNGSWSTFNATCGQAKRFGTEVVGVGGSMLAQSGYILSPNFPLEYPDDNAEYYWTVVVTNGSYISFQFLTLDTEQSDVDCLASSNVAIYCGMNIPSLHPSYGPYCGSVVPDRSSRLPCMSECAIIRFTTVLSITGNRHKGFHLVWETS